MPLSAWLAEWQATPRESPETAATYKAICNIYIIPQLGGAALGDLDPATIERWLVKLASQGSRTGKPLSKATVSIAASVLSAALGKAKTRKLIPANPCLEAEFPAMAGPARGKIKAWTPAERDRFLGWAAQNDPGHYALYYTAAMTGLRVSEACSLVWEDVSAGQLVVQHGKGGKRRVIPLSEATQDVLAWHRRERALAGLDTDASLIFGQPDGLAYPRRTASHAFSYAVARCRKDLGEGALPVISFHGLRHTMATTWLRAGVPAAIVAQRLGHAHPGITHGIYSRLVDDGQQAAWAGRVAEPELMHR